MKVIPFSWQAWRLVNFAQWSQFILVIITAIKDTDLVIKSFVSVIG